MKKDEEERGDDKMDITLHHNMAIDTIPFMMAVQKYIRMSCSSFCSSFSLIVDWQKK
jgi:hypothetical protein